MTDHIPESREPEAPGTLQVEPIADGADSEDRKSLTHDTLFSAIATGTRTLGAVAIFWMMARYLGKEQYGIYAAALALFLLIGSFVSLGTGHILVKRLSVDRSAASQAWGAALLPGLLLAFLFSTILALLGTIAVPGMDSRAIFLLALAEFLAAAVSLPASQALQALDRFRHSAALTVYWTILRFAFVAMAFFVFDRPTLFAVSLAMLAATLLANVTNMAVLAHFVGRPHFSIAESIQICREGWPFSLTQASVYILGDIDKQMLVRAPDGFALNGIYAASNRVIGLAATPIYAVLGATYPRFFARGDEEGLRGTWNYARKLMGPVTLFALAAGIGLFITAPLVDDILGAEFTDSIGTIRLMSAIPLFHLPGLMAAEALTGAGFQQTRNKFIIAAGGLNIVMNLFLIRAYGINGVIIATYAAEIFLLLGISNWIRTHINDDPGVN